MIMEGEEKNNNQDSGLISKKEKYLLKRKQKEQKQLHQVSRKKITKLLIIFLPVLIAIGGLVFLMTNRVSQNPQLGLAKIEITPKEYDVGNIPIGGGLVKRDYEIKNIGSGDLKINDIWTSCHCTTAILKVAGKESPKFGMDHAGFWSQILASGEIAQLEVIFDPAFHGPQETGLAVREIYLSTNDPQNKKATVRLTAEVTP